MPYQSAMSDKEYSVKRFRCDTNNTLKVAHPEAV